MSRSRAYPIVLIVLLALLAGLGLTPAAATAYRGAEPPGRSRGEQHYFEVNSNVDDNMAHDKNAGDCICEAWLNGCTLRAAIEEANACAGTDTIAFHSSLQGAIIYLDGGEGQLEYLYEAITISAQSIWDSANDQPGLTLHGGNGNFEGFFFVADGCAVYGLYITAFQQGAVFVQSAYNYIGGPYVGQRNILSGNLAGVRLYGADAHHNTIQGNWIGLDSTGDSANPNTEGISIDMGAHDNTIGGANAGEGNVISGNTGSGVYIANAGSDGNRLGGNIVGLAADGSSLLGNGLDGVFVVGGPQNTTIGTPLAGNVIAANQGNGIRVQDCSSYSIQGNTVNGNVSDGIEIASTPDGQILANTIAYNHENGVLVGTSSLGNLIVANSIHDNVGQGIALEGGNGDQPAPTITGATPTRVEGTACASCMVHVYSDNAEEGETYHGAANADASGNWVYTGTIAGPNATATNTDSGNNTSEFSTPVPVSTCTPVTGVTISGPATGDVGAAVCFTATVTPGNATLPIDYLWAPSPGSGQGTYVACYTWATPGDKVITVTASNCGGTGSAQATHTITIGEVCTPVGGVTISGPTTGDVGAAVCFTATVAPGNATEPIDYLWDPVPDGQGNSYVCYTWMNPGTYVFTVTASNCGGTGSAQDTHTVVIGGGSCVPVTGVTINGPTTGLVGVPYGFGAAVVPANATAPIQYTWTPAPGGGQGTANASYTWSAAGTYNVGVAVSNCGGAGTGSDDHSIVISAGTVYQVFLPLVAKH